MKKQYKGKDITAIKNDSQTKFGLDNKIPWYTVGIFFAVITAVFFWDVLAGNAFFWEDFAEYVYPVQTLAASSDGIPFWNPFTLGGMPFLADLQVGFFYPLNRIFSLFVGANGQVPASIIQNITILHFFIALCSMFALMRSFKISKLGAILAAISYAFSFSLVLQVIHPMILAHLSWFPLVVMLLYKSISAGNLRSGIIGGLIFGMSMLSGHPQILLYEGVFLGIFAIWHFVAAIKNGEYKRENRNLVKVIVAGALVFAISAGIFQIQYQHTNELTENTMRSEMTYEKASEGSLDVKQIFMALSPKMFGYERGDRNSSVRFQMPTTDAAGKSITAPYYYYWETNFYFGIVAIIIGLFGFLANPKQKHSAFFIAISVFGFLFSLGSNGFLFSIFQNFPIFDKFRFPSRMMFFVTFSFAAMSGFGFDKLIFSSKELAENNVNNAKKSENNNKFRIKLFTAIAIVAAGVLLILAGVFTPDNLRGNASELSSFATTAIIFTLIVAGITIAAFYKKIPYSAAGISLIIVAFVDLYVAGKDFNASPDDFTQKYKADPQYSAAFTPKTPNDLFRVSMRHYDYGVMAMQRNSGMLTKMMLVEGYNPLVLERYELPRPTREERNKLWNTKFEVTVDTIARQVYFRERTGENLLPRAWLAAKVRTIPTEQIFDFMMKNDINFRDEVLLEENVNYNLPAELDANAEVKFEKYDANSMLIQVKSNSGGMLVLSEVFYPAWKAKLDDNEAKIYRANYNFRAVYVPPGKHTIEMQYESEAFASGRLITLIVLILSLFGFVISFVFDKRSRKIK